MTPSEHIASKDHREMYLFLLFLTIASTVGLQTWMTLLTNFAVERAGIDGFEMGTIQSVREIPGLLALLAVYLLLVIREHKLAALSIVVLGLGVSLAGFFPSFTGIICTTLIMSFGFHYFETMNMSLSLQYFDKQTAPVVMGKLRAWSSVSNIVVGGVVFCLMLFLDYTVVFALAGVTVMLTGSWCLLHNPVDTTLPVQHKRIILRWRYWLFYALTFLAGARRQIFIAFAVFLLVEKFSYSIQAVTLLFVINNAVNAVAAPYIGKAINRFGERAVLSLEYAGLIVVFAGYAYTESPLVAGILYVLDHLFFNFAVAIRTYFQKIADPADIAPGMATGFTINHIAAVVLPVLGGLVWLSNYRFVFLAGALLSALSLLLCQCIPPTGQKTK